MLDFFKDLVELCSFYLLLFIVGTLFIIPVSLIAIDLNCLHLLDWFSISVSISLSSND